MPEASHRHRHGRLVASMQFLQLMARTFSTLHLTDHDSIGDTLSALTGSFLDCRVRMMVRVEAEGLRVVAHEGLDEDALAAVSSEPGRALWAWVMADKPSHAITSEELLARWPDPPAALREGLGCAVIELHDEPVGLLVVAGKRSYEPFSDEEMTFLAVAAGLGSMAVANANAHHEQRAQRELAEARAELAAAEARDKQAALAELDAKLAIIASQRDEIATLSTPILRLRPGVLALPLIGTVDAARGEIVLERLMAELAQTKARFAILDVTGVGVIDTMTADYFLRVVRCTSLLGATCILTGIRPAVAQTLVSLGADLSALVTCATLGDGLDECSRRLASRRPAGG